MPLSVTGRSERLAALGLRTFVDGFLLRSLCDLLFLCLQLTEDRSFPHEEASADMGFTPRSFRQGIGDEIEAYLTALERISGDYQSLLGKQKLITAGEMP